MFADGCTVLVPPKMCAISPENYPLKNAKQKRLKNIPSPKMLAAVFIVVQKKIKITDF
jgi:hypothetical protein